MVKLSNSPHESTVLILEARKSFALRIELFDRHEEEMSWMGLSATFTMGTLDPFEQLLSVNGLHGLFYLQASDLDLPIGAYPFSITLNADGYSLVIVKGEVQLRENTDVGSAEHDYAGTAPSETLAVMLDRTTVLQVFLKNTPITIGTEGLALAVSQYLDANPIAPITVIDNLDGTLLIGGPGVHDNHDGTLTLGG